MCTLALSLRQMRCDVIAPVAVNIEDNSFEERKQRKRKFLEDESSPRSPDGDGDDDDGTLSQKAKKRKKLVVSTDQLISTPALANHDGAACPSCSSGGTLSVGFAHTLTSTTTSALAFFSFSGSNSKPGSFQPFASSKFGGCEFDTSLVTCTGCKLSQELKRCMDCGDWATSTSVVPRCANRVSCNQGVGEKDDGTKSQYCKRCFNACTCDTCGRVGCSCHFVQCAHSSCAATMCMHSAFDAATPEPSFGCCVSVVWPELLRAAKEATCCEAKECGGEPRVYCRAHAPSEGFCVRV